jgi:hypothetical protein
MFLHTCLQMHVHGVTSAPRPGPRRSRAGAGSPPPPAVLWHSGQGVLDLGPSDSSTTQDWFTGRPLTGEEGESDGRHRYPLDVAEMLSAPAIGQMESEDQHGSGCRPRVKIIRTRAAPHKAEPEKITQPPQPTPEEIDGDAILDAPAPTAYLRRVTVQGRETALDDFIKRIHDGDTQLCITDQAPGAANLPVGGPLTLSRRTQ